jgi:4a-hydroxytetrahydrobiopterin dehydratase
MILGAQIAEAGLTDWRKLAQGLHARYLVDTVADGVRLVAVIGEAGDTAGHHPRVVIGAGHVDLELVTADAIYRDDDGTEYVVEWPTQQDVDLARAIPTIWRPGLRGFETGASAPSSTSGGRAPSSTNEHERLPGGHDQ